MTGISRHGVFLPCLFVAIATLAGQETPPPGVAQTPGQPAPPSLTLAAVAARALADDPGMVAAQADRAAAYAAIVGGRRWDDPLLSLEGAHHDQSEDEPWRVRLAVTQRIVPPAVRRAGVAAFQAEATAAETLVAVRHLEIAREVRDLAVAVLAADLRANALEEEHQATRRLAGVVRDRVAAGHASTSDLLLAQVDEHETALAVTLIGQEAIASRARLARRLGRTGAEIGAIVVGPAGAPSLAEVLAAAARHPSVTMAAQAVDAQRAGRLGAAAAAIPELRVGVFAERDGAADEVGLAVELPIPAWNGNRSGRAGAEARVQAASANLLMARRRAEMDAEAAWYAWDAARIQVEYLDQQVIPVVIAARRIAEADWAAGTSTLSAVLTLQRRVSRLRGEHTDALAARERARNALIAATAAPEAP